MYLEDSLCYVDPNDRSLLHGCLLPYGWSCNITSVAHLMPSGGGIHPIKTHKVVLPWRLVPAQLPTSMPSTGSSDVGHKRTHAPQQKADNSMISSARPTNGRGTVMPSALAVFILMSGAS